MYYDSRLGKGDFPLLSAKGLWEELAATRAASRLNPIILALPAASEALPTSTMNALISLWLPILLSAVVVFVISCLVHMVFKWHAGDYSPLVNEDAVRAAINAGNPKPGRYVVPHCKDMKNMGSEAMMRKYAEGPVGHFTLGPTGQPNMGKYLGQWFLLCVVVSVVAAFVATQIFGLNPGRVRAASKLVGAVSFIAYGFGTLQESIWMMRPWSGSAKYLLDAALYALGSALVFYWLWP